MEVLRRARDRLLLAAALVFGVAPVFAQPTEYDVKAVFLFNFTQFVDWPPPAFVDEQSPLEICVLGSDPFGASLDEVVRGETVNGRSLTVRRSGRVEDVESCHILFIGRSERERLARVLGSLRGRSILTVGDFEGFTRIGGVIRFVTVGKKIRLHVNLEAARAAQLNISSKVLRPARIVTPGED